LPAFEDSSGGGGERRVARGSIAKGEDPSSSRKRPMAQTAYEPQPAAPFWRRNTETSRRAAKIRIKKRKQGSATVNSRHFPICERKNVPEGRMGTEKEKTLRVTKQRPALFPGKGRIGSLREDTEVEQ